MLIFDNKKKKIIILHLKHIKNVKSLIKIRVRSIPCTRNSIVVKILNEIITLYLHVVYEIQHFFYIFVPITGLLA